jgi:hypothetical protein
METHEYKCPHCYDKGYIEWYDRVTLTAGTPTVRPALHASLTRRSMTAWWTLTHTINWERYHVNPALMGISTRATVLAAIFDNGLIEGNVFSSTNGRWSA